MLHGQPGCDENTSGTGKHFREMDSEDEAKGICKLLIDRSKDPQDFFRINRTREAGLKAGRKFLGRSTSSSLASSRHGDRLAAGE